MKIKRSVALPAYIDRWLQQKSKKNGLSISAIVTHELMKAFEENNNQKGIKKCTK